MGHKRIHWEVDWRRLGRGWRKCVRGIHKMPRRRLGKGSRWAIQGNSNRIRSSPWLGQVPSSEARGHRAGWGNPLGSDNFPFPTQDFFCGSWEWKNHWLISAGRHARGKTESSKKPTCFQEIKRYASGSRPGAGEDTWKREETDMGSPFILTFKWGRKLRGVSLSNK